MRGDTKLCSIDGCNGVIVARKFCNKHYLANKIHGDPLGKAKVHNVSNHKMYSTWSGMINRCHNPKNSSYHQYGARGITVCDEWRFREGRKPAFLVFLSDMGERPDGMTLDRIDPHLGYSKENCRWATHLEQRSNQTEDGKRRQAIGASIGRTKSAHNHPLEMLVLNTLRNRNETIRSFSRSNGLSSHNYVIRALRGEKESSALLIDALLSIWVDIRHWSTDFTKRAANAR